MMYAYLTKTLPALICATLLTACGGGNNQTSMYIKDITLNRSSTPINVVGTDNNGSKGYVDIDLGSSAETVTLTTKITFNNFFKYNPVGHFALALKADSNTTDYVQGQGVAIGALYDTPQGSSFPFSAHIENWQLGSNEVLRVTEYPVEDNVEYDLVVYTTPTDTRYTLSYQGNLLKDTGYIKNNMSNVGSKSNVIFAFVFGDPDNYSWSITLKDIHINW
jgi:hypothetical protein